MQGHFRNWASLDLIMDSALPDLDSIIPLVYLLDQKGFHPSPATGGEPLYRAADIESLLIDRYTDFEAAGIDMGERLRSVGCQIILDGLPPGVALCNFNWSVYRSKGDKPIPRVSLVGSVYSSLSEQSEHYQLLSNKLYLMGKDLYSHLRPEYGCIENMDIERHPYTDSFALLHEIVTLSWVNFFGLGYTRKFGQDLLSHIPGYQTEDLDDGGILYQSRESIQVENELRHRRWQTEAQQYLAQHGIPIHFDYISFYD